MVKEYQHSIWVSSWLVGNEEALKQWSSNCWNTTPFTEDTRDPQKTQVLHRIS